MIHFSFSSSRAMPFVHHLRFEAELKGKKIKDRTDYVGDNDFSVIVFMASPLFPFPREEEAYSIMKVPLWDHLRASHHLVT